MADPVHDPSNRLTFSQRYGYEPLPEPMRVGELSKDVRRKICDLIDGVFSEFWEKNPVFDEYDKFSPSGTWMILEIFGEYLNRPRQEIDTGPGRVSEIAKDVIMTEKANKSIDFLEIVINNDVLFQKHNSKLGEYINKIFDEANAPYRVNVSRRPFRFVQQASKETGEAARHAIDTLHRNDMDPAAAHLRGASEHINAGQYADSIADSIHAVESVARGIDLNASKTLGPALKSLEKAGKLKHPALRDAFDKLYGYTNDEQGVRHALIDRDAADVGLDEALFMFGACASFAAYLSSKARQIDEQA